MKHSITILTLAAALAAAPAAQAKIPVDDGGGSSYATGVVKVNKGHTLTVRTAPRAGAPAIRSIPRNRVVRIVCQTQGDTMTGRFGTSRVWDKLAKGGFVTDTYVYTGSDSRVAPPCGKPAGNGGGGGGGGRPASIKLRDDYPFASGSWNDVDPWAFYKRECTSFVAYRLNKVMQFHNTMRGGRFSDAKNWDDNAKRIGFRVNRTPKVGSVMVRDSGTWGHVAMVAKVAPGRIFVEQYNAGGTHTYSKQWLDSAGMKFIHFPKGR